MSLHVLSQLSLTSATMQLDSRRKYTTVSVAFVVFVTSESKEQGVNINLKDGITKCYNEHIMNTVIYVSTTYLLKYRLHVSPQR
jgi:hypothetical protein